jgi:hypothetical protein
MLVIQIQMWPKGDKTKAYSMGTLTVALKPGTKSDGLRAYTWAISKFADKGVWKKGHIEGHNPKIRGPWDLVYRILRQAVGDRNPV